MKKEILLLASILAFATGTARAETIHVGVDGMVCAFCAKGIEKSFKARPETEKVDVSLEDKLVTVTTKKDTILKDETISKIIEDSGYKATTIHHQK